MLLWLNTNSEDIWYSGNERDNLRYRYKDQQIVRVSHIADNLVYLEDPVMEAMDTIAGKSPVARLFDKSADGYVMDRPIDMIQECEVSNLTVKQQPTASWAAISMGGGYRCKIDVWVECRNGISL